MLATPIALEVLLASSGVHMPLVIGVVVPLTMVIVVVVPVAMVVAVCHVTSRRFRRAPRWSGPKDDA